MAHKTTVTLADHSWRVLQDLTTSTGYPMVEIIRQALAMYAWWREMRARGDRFLVQRSSGEVREIVTFG